MSFDFHFPLRQTCSQLCWRKYEECGPYIKYTHIHLLQNPWRHTTTKTICELNGVTDAIFNDTGKRISHTSRDISVVMRSELRVGWLRNIGSNSQSVQIHSGAHRCFYSMGTVVTLAGIKRQRHENDHLSLHPLPSLRLRGAIPPIPYKLRWHAREEFQFPPFVPTSYFVGVMCPVPLTCCGPSST